MKNVAKGFVLSFLLTSCFVNFPAWADDPLEDYPKPLGAQWGQRYYSDTSGRSIIAIPNGYVVAGTQNGLEGPGIDTWATLVRFDLNGNVAATKTFHDESDHNGAADIIASYDSEDNLDGYIITGSRHQAFSEDGHNWYNPWMWLMKVNTAFEKQWESTFGDPWSDYGYSAMHDGSGYIISGMYSNPNESGYLVRTDESGNSTWSIYSLTPWFLSPVVYSSVRAGDGGLVLATSMGLRKLSPYTEYSPPPEPDTDDWTASSSDKFFSVIAVAGGYVATGSARIDGDPVHNDLVLIKVDTSGNVVWRQTYGRPAPALGATGMNDIGREVIQTSDGSLAVIGTTESYAWHGGSDMWLIKTDADGVMQWDVVMGDAGGDYGYGIVQDADNALVAVGTTGFEESGWIYVVKFSGNFHPPSPSFEYSPQSPFFIQETIQFDASGSSPGGAGDGILLYEWDFGDGNSSTGMIADHIYIKPGTYTVTLYVTDTNGVRRETSREVTARGLEMWWERTFGKGFYDLAEGDGDNLLLCGMYCLSSSNCNVWATKVNYFGDTLWEKVYPDTYYSGRDGARKGILGHDNNYILAGFRDKGTAGDTRDVRIIKVAASDGTKLWDKVYDMGLYDEAFDIKRVSSGGYIVIGAGYIAAGVANLDAWLIKIDENGDQEWSQTYSNTGDLALYGMTVTPTEDNGFLLVCSRTDSFSDQPIISIKTDASGVELWRHTITNAAGTHSNKGAWVHQARDSNFRIAGSLNDDFALITLDVDGDYHDAVTWGTEYDRDYIVDADVTPDGGYVMVGNRYDEVNDDDVYVVRTDSQGNVAWWLTLGEAGVGGENGNAIAYLSDGSVVVLSSDYYDGVTRLTKFGPLPSAKGDISGDSSVNLSDAILALQVLVGLVPPLPVNMRADVDGDIRIGLEEVIYIFQKVSGARQAD